MNKEILEITKKFHDTYEKLASEYTYKTREDTKVFDINSNNGKLMYATVNEIVSPILKENKKQKEVIDKAKSLNHEISHTIYEDFLEENIIGSKFLYERIKKQLSILEDKEVSE